jgi:hypothetical protein
MFKRLLVVAICWSRSHIVGVVALVALISVTFGFVSARVASSSKTNLEAVAEAAPITQSKSEIVAVNVPRKPLRFIHPMSKTRFGHLPADQAVAQDAISVAKSSYSLLRAGSNGLDLQSMMQRTINETFLNNWVAQQGDGIEVEGWSADRRDYAIHVVTFSVLRDGRRQVFRFEVDHDSGQCRNIDGNSELENKYPFSD